MRHSLLGEASCRSMREDASCAARMYNGGFRKVGRGGQGVRRRGQVSWGKIKSQQTHQGTKAHLMHLHFEFELQFYRLSRPMGCFPPQLHYHQQYLRASYCGRSLSLRMRKMRSACNFSCSWDRLRHPPNLTYSAWTASMQCSGRPIAALRRLLTIRSISYVYSCTGEQLAQTSFRRCRVAGSGSCSPPGEERAEGQRGVCVWVQEGGGRRSASWSRGCRRGNCSMSRVRQEGACEFIRAFSMTASCSAVLW